MAHSVGSSVVERVGKNRERVESPIQKLSETGACLLFTKVG